MQENTLLEEKEKFIKEKPAINMVEVSKIFNESLPNISSTKNNEIVLFIGNTGSGKSTTVNYLLGCEFVSDFFDDGVERAIPKEGSKIYAQIGNDLASETIYPQAYLSDVIYSTDSRLVYCDCPGFLDNRGNETNIVVKLNTQIAIQLAKSVKAVAVVCEWPSLLDAKGGNFRTVAETLGSIINHPASIAKSIFFIVTKCPDRIKKPQVISRISKLIEANSNKDPENVAILNLFKNNHSSIMLIDIFDEGKTRSEIINQLKKSPSIPANAFDFVKHNSEMDNFNTALVDVICDALELFNKYKEIPKKLKDLEKDKTNLETTIVSINDRIQFLTGNRRTKEESQNSSNKLFKAYEERINFKKGIVDYIEKQKIDIEKKLNKIDTNDKELLFEDRFLQGFFDSSKKFFYKGGVPILEIEKDCKQGTFFVEREDRKKGIYIVQFNPNSKFGNGVATIKLFAKRKDLPANTRLILKKKEELKKIIEELDKAIDEWTSLSIKSAEIEVNFNEKLSDSDSKARIKVDEKVESHTKEIQNINIKINEFKQSIAQAKKELANVFRLIDQNEKLYDSISLILNEIILYKDWELSRSFLEGYSFYHDKKSNVIQMMKSSRELPSNLYERVLQTQMPLMPCSVNEIRNQWYFDIKTERKADPTKLYQLLEATDQDKAKVISFYQHHPVPGYEIGSVEVIYNREFNQGFEIQIKRLQQRHNNPAFAPRWEVENDAAWRETIHRQWETLSEPYIDSEYPAVKLLPLWHGTRPEILDSLFKTGYANLATTDSGYFGKGIYSTYEAEYSHRVYSRGSLILNWVAMYSAYPVIDGDKDKIEGRGNYQNYDSHFIPVAPRDLNNPNEKIYFPCKPNQKHTYIEVVVFEATACLPRYLVQLQASCVKPIPSIQNSAVKFFLREDALNFQNWYHPEICHYLLQMVDNQAKCVHVLFPDADEGNNTEVFKEQLFQLVMLSKALKRPALFVSKEPGADNHFICGLIKDSNLLLVNPLGITTHKICYETLVELKDKNILKEVWLSSNSLQKRQYEEENLVSCGPISLELSVHILTKFTPEGLERFCADNLKAKEPTIDAASGLTYYGINIKDLLPDILQELINIKDKYSYQRKVCQIRNKHCEQLQVLPIERTKNSDISVEVYLSKCKESAPHQLVFNALMTAEKGINEIDQLPEFTLLKKEVNTDIKGAVLVSGNDNVLSPKDILIKKDLKSEKIDPQIQYDSSIKASKEITNEIQRLIKKESFSFTIKRTNSCSLSIFFTALDEVLMTTNDIRDALVKLSKLLKENIEYLNLTSVNIKPYWTKYCLEITCENFSDTNKVAALLKSAGVGCWKDDALTAKLLFFKSATEESKNTVENRDVICAIQ